LFLFLFCFNCYVAHLHSEVVTIYTIRNIYALLSFQWTVFDIERVIVMFLNMVADFVRLLPFVWIAHDV
jgi:hypothetical protein